MTATRSEEHSETTPWYTLVFVTIAFFLIDHNLRASVDVSFHDLTSAGEKAQAVSVGSLRRQVGYVVFGLYGIIAWLRAPSFRLNARGPAAIALFAYLAWAALSLVWSVSPMLTIRRLGTLGLMGLGITGLLRQLSGQSLVQLLFYSTLGYLVLGIGTELVLGSFRPWAAGYRFAGTLHPNIQGINCVILAFSAFALTATSTRFRPVFFAIACGAVGFLLLTTSRASLAAFVAASWAALIVKARPSLAIAGVLVLSCGGLLGILLVTNGIVPSPLPLLLTERAAGAGVLSGRTELWALLIDYARARPILGYGYGAFFDPSRSYEVAAQVGIFAFGGPHSLYLGTLLDVGLVGTTLMLVFLASGAVRGVLAYRQTLAASYLLFTTLLVFQLIEGIAEAEMLTPNPHIVPGLAIAFLALRAPRQQSL